MRNINEAIPKTGRVESSVTIIVQGIKMKPYQRLAELKERNGMKRERQCWSYFLTNLCWKGDLSMVLITRTCGLRFALRKRKFS